VYLIHYILSDPKKNTSIRERLITLEEFWWSLVVTGGHWQSILCQSEAENIERLRESFFCQGCSACGFAATAPGLSLSQILG